MSVSRRATTGARGSTGGLAVRLQTSRDLPGIILVAPAILTLAALLGYSSSTTSGSASTRSTRSSRGTWVGLANYTYFLFGDRQFWDSFWLGLVYAIVTVAQLVLVAAALLLNEDFRGRLIVAGIALFPYMIPITLSVIIWRWIFNNQYGIANHLIVGTRITSRLPWLGLDLLDAVHDQRLDVLPVRADLDPGPPPDDPAELYDAAKVDGAGAVGRFLHITLPQIQTVLFIVILLRSVWMFTKFDIVWMWGGSRTAASGEHGSCRCTRTTDLRVVPGGEGAALANIMFFMLLFAAYFYFRYFQHDEASV